MTGRARHYLLASLLCIGLLALVATGGVATADPADYCETVGETDSAIVGDDEIDAEYREYLGEVSETQNATAALNETTSDLVAGDGDLNEANKRVHTLKDNYTDMRNAQGDLLDRLKTDGESGNVTGAVGAAATVEEQHQRTEANVTAAATAYTDAVEAEANDPRSTVQLSVFGSLGVGVALGLLAGATVPLVAARRVKEKMKLSRDVSYDPKTALLPIFLGLVAAAAGVAFLAVRVELGSLLRVIA